MPNTIYLVAERTNDDLIPLCWVEHKQDAQRLADRYNKQDTWGTWEVIEVKRGEL